MSLAHSVPKSARLCSFSKSDQKKKPGYLFLLPPRTTPPQCPLHPNLLLWVEILARNLLTLPVTKTREEIGTFRPFLCEATARAEGEASGH